MTLEGTHITATTVGMVRPEKETLENCQVRWYRVGHKIDEQNSRKPQDSKTSVARMESEFCIASPRFWVVIDAHDQIFTKQQRTGLGCCPILQNTPVEP